MDVTDLLLDLYGRIGPEAHDAVEGLPLATLTEAPPGGTNTIAWLVWHLARVQDGHISELVPQPQLWEDGDWAPRFGLAPDPRDSGYGHTPAQVAAVRPESPEALLGYLDAVTERTEAFLRGVDPQGLDRVVDRHWDPPVTLGVRLVSVADDCIQHAGQAAFVRGLLAGRAG